MKRYGWPLPVLCLLTGWQEEPIHVQDEVLFCAQVNAFVQQHK